MPAVPTRGTMSRWSRARPGSGCRRSSMAGKRRNTARSPTTLPFLVSSTADIADAPWWEIKKKRYVYYHCTGYRGKCPEPYTREEVLERQFSDSLRDLIVPVP